MTEQAIYDRVHHYYWVDDFNCATTILKTLAEHFGVQLHPQLIDAAIGMHGAGCFGAQCGLVEGTLLFLGVYGRAKGIDEDVIISACNAFAGAFTNEFGSLLCRDLRKEGFSPVNPPHLCEKLTVRAVAFSIKYIESMNL